MHTSRRCLLKPPTNYSQIVCYLLVLAVTSLRNQVHSSSAIGQTHMELYNIASCAMKVLKFSIHYYIAVLPCILYFDDKKHLSTITKTQIII